MAATNIEIFNRYSSNIAEDGAIAIYDVLPDPVLIGEVIGGIWQNTVTPTGVPSGLTDYAFYEIPSSHCTKDSSAYYLFSKLDLSDKPTVSGIPMNYGGTNRVRYFTLSPNITKMPLILTPSFGFGHDYADRARSYEFWLNTEPYSHSVNSNLLPDSVATLNPTDLAGHTGITLNITGANALNDPVDAGESYTGSVASAVTFDGAVVHGGRVYTASIKAKGTGTLDLSMKFIQVPASMGTELSKTYTKTFTLTSTWTTYSFDFLADDIMTFPETQMIIETSALTYIAELGFWAGTGGVWTNNGQDVRSDVVVFEVAAEAEPLLEFGGVNGSALTLMADNDYIYLHSGQQKVSYHVGEWGRPLHIVLLDADDSYKLYLNGEEVLSINRYSLSTGLTGEWAMFYLSSRFKYIDLSTIAVYKAILAKDTIKLHFLFGSGPDYNDVINKQQYDKVYVADGSATEFSGKILFPQTQPFKFGYGSGVDTNNDYLALPSYELPTLRGATYSDIVYGNLSTTDYGLMYFQLPQGAEMSITPKTQIGSDIDYMFIDVVSPINITGEEASFRICRVDAPTLDYALDFHFYLITGTGDFDSTDFSSDDFNTERRLGRIVVVPVYKEGTAKTYAGYEGLFDVGTTFQNDMNYQISTYGEAAGTGDIIYEQVIEQTDFTLCLNIKELMLYSNRIVSSLFSSEFFSLRFDENVYLRSVSFSNTNNLHMSGILKSGETDIEAIQIDPMINALGFDSRNLIGRATCSFYPNIDTTNGLNRFIDIAANGFWKVNIPLTSMASYVNGIPDLDFIEYVDSESRPQIVYNLNAIRQSYSEVQSYVYDNSNDLYGSSTNVVGAHDLFDSLQYEQVGINVVGGDQRLGRFYNQAVRTYVTLDSYLRWPYKSYENLGIEQAGLSRFIDFENSVRSVENYKWEIFNGFGIRIPKNITLGKYELGYAVHLSTRSMAFKNPTFRRAEFFGVASGNNPYNAVGTGNGQKVLVGVNGIHDVSNNYSLNIPTESLPSNFMPREHGYYPHVGREAVNLVFPLGDNTSSVSFYMLWREESFGSDNITFANIDFKNTTTSETIGLVVVPSIPTPYEAKIDFTSTELVGVQELTGDIYVDGVHDGTISANKWHLIQIDLNIVGQITAPYTDTRLSLTTDRAVLNYVTSHNKEITPLNLYASRFGSSNCSVSDIASTTTMTDSAKIVMFSELKQPSKTMRINI